MAKRRLSTYERLTGGKLNRKQRKDLLRKIASEDPGLEIVHPNAAGIDIGNESHYVAVSPDRDSQPVQEFGCWTADLRRMAAWLRQCGIETVVMQSTGVYWIAVYEVLEEAGLRVWLCNARETRNLPGRKSDVQECQWLRKLHLYGLLRNSFLPAGKLRGLRTLWRLRQRHVQDASREVQHMQKALTSMNVQLANAISDVSGVTGMAIIEAILEGERDPWKLAALRDRRVKASAEEIARSLEGTWQEDLLFELKQAVERYRFCQKQIGECDKRLEAHLAGMPGGPAPQAEMPVAEAGNAAPAAKRNGRKPRNHQPQFDLHTELRRICGVDLTSIDGVDVMTVQTFVAELGADMSPWPSEDHLVSWLKLSPRRQISGGKLIRHEAAGSSNRVATALRMAASTLIRSDSYLGARYRQLRMRLGAPKAIKAMAAYLARLFYRMLTKGKAWVDQGAREYQRRREAREQSSLERRAAERGFRLVPIS